MIEPLVSALQEAGKIESESRPTRFHASFFRVTEIAGLHRSRAERRSCRIALDVQFYWKISRRFLPREIPFPFLCSFFLFFFLPKARARNRFAIAPFAQRRGALLRHAFTFSLRSAATDYLDG